MRIRFTAFVDQIYSSGSEHDFAPSIADLYIQRGVAVLVPESESLLEKSETFDQSRHDKMLRSGNVKKK